MLVNSTAGPLEVSPIDDGVTHINMYSNANTQLGRGLSHFGSGSFTHPLYGFFRSMEAAWVWFSTGKQFDEVKSLTGAKAKKFGKDLERVKYDTFFDDIEECLRLRFREDRLLFEAFLACPVPLTHYLTVTDKYDFEPPSSKEIVPIYAKLLAEGRATGAV